MFNDYFSGGFVVGAITGSIIASFVWGGFKHKEEEKLKDKYVKLEIASYNTITGAFTFKDEYKLLGEK